MRPLTQKQASNCEMAKHPTCKCRCNGKLHGAKRVVADAQGNAPAEFFEKLDEGDAHSVPSPERAKELRKERARARKQAKREAYWKALEEMLKAPAGMFDMP